MKKIFSFATILAVLVACNGKNGPEVVVDYQMQEHAGYLDFSLGTKPNVPYGQGQNVRLEGIHHFGNGDYKGEGFVIDNPLSTKTAVSQVFVGRYTIANDGGVSYVSGELSGASLKEENGSFIFRMGSSSGKGNLAPTTPPSDPTTKALCGAHWKLSSIEGKLKNKDVSVNFTDKDGINPNDVEHVAEYLNKKGAEIPMSKVQGCYIKSIGLNVNPNTIIIEFVDPMKAPLEGTWAPDLLKKSFTYTLSTDLDGKLFDGEASGTFKFADNNNTLILEMTAKASSDLAGDIIIKAKKVN